MSGVTPWRLMPFVVRAMAVAFLATYAAFFFAPAATQEALYAQFGVIPLRFQYEGASAGALFSLVSHVLLHGGWLHVGMNTLVFLQGAPLVARRLGDARFLVLFLVSAALGGLAYVWINPGSPVPAVGASGGVCGVFAAYFLAVRPSPRMALADPGVRNAIAMFLLVNVGLAGLAAVAGVFPIAWETHLGGFLGGGAAYLALAPRRAIGPWG